MAYTAWNLAFEGTPAGSDTGSVIDDRIQELKEQLRFIMHSAGITIPGTRSASSTTGVPAATYVMAVDANHGVADWPNSPIIYKADGVTPLMTPTDAGVDFPVAATGVNITSANNPGHGHDATIMVPLSHVGATGRIENLVFWNLGNGTVTALEVRLVAFDPSSSGNTELQIVKLVAPTNTTDVGTAAGTDMFDNAKRPTLNVSHYFSNSFSDFSGGDATLPSGDAWVFELDVLGTDCDALWASIEVRRV